MVQMAMEMGMGGLMGSSNGGGVSEAWSAKYKKSIDCDNPKGFSQRAHCQGRKKVNEATMSPAKKQETMLKKKYDKSDMKQNMIDQYGEKKVPRFTLPLFVNKR